MATIRFKLHKVVPGGDESKATYAGVPVIDSYKTEDEVVAAIVARSQFSKAQAEAFAQALTDAIVDTMRLNCAFTESDFVRIATYCKGSFETATGPWNAEKNSLKPSATTLGSFNTAFTADGYHSFANAIEVLTPVINNITDNTTHVEGTIKKGDVIYIAGNNLSINTSASDEGVEIRSEDGTLVCKCSVTSCDRITCDCSFSQDVPAGDYYIWVNTRCGQGSEYKVQTVKKAVKVEA